MPEYWDLSGRDVVPDLTPAGRPRDVGGALLLGILDSDGAPWRPPYTEVRRALNVRAKPVEPELQEQADQRLRTYFALFRGLGLVYEQDGVVHITDLGRSLRALLWQQYSATDDLGRELALAARWRLARLVGPALARYQLANPLAAEYPVGTDIHPLWAIWRAMRALGNRLHWDEMDRTLTTCLRNDEVPDAVAKIRDARSTPGYDADDPNLLSTLLGPRRPEVSSQSDRLDVWFSRAGFKGLLLESRDRSDGYRYLREEFVPLLDELTAEVPPHINTQDKSEYVRWLGSAGPAVSGPSAEHASGIVARVVDRCRRYGDHRVIALAGPAGTGKTTVASKVAAILADSDPTRMLTLQFHAAYTYEEFVGGLAPAQDGPGFVPTAGTLLDFNDRARDRPELSHVLVVDELSRADVANVFGELLTYVEYRDRSFHIPTLNRDVQLAPNLIVLATLNPEDRSVVNMDDALVRRLRQIPIEPDPDALRAILDDAGMAPNLRNEVVEWFDDLPEDIPFGHGVFVGVNDEDDLRDLWHEQLQYFLRRGGVTVYPDPDAVASGYRWRHQLPNKKPDSFKQVAGVTDVAASENEGENETDE